jgi:predicted MFS family arabinose efflux permease
MYPPVVSATSSDVVTAGDRPRAYGLIYWAVNLGASIAPLIGGVIAARSYRLLFAADAATTVLYGVIVWIALPETRTLPQTAATTTHSAVRVVFTDRVFVAVCILTFAFSVIFFQSFVGLPIDMRAHGMSASAFGAVIALNGLLIVCLQPFATEVIRDRSRPLALAAASLLLAAGFGMNAWVSSIGGYAVAVAVWTLGEILFAPASTSLVADLALPHLRGAYQGAFALASTAAFAVAPLAGGRMIARAGPWWLWIACLAGGLVVSVGFFLLSRHPTFTRGDPRAHRSENQG